MSGQIFMLAGEASGDRLGGLILSEMEARGFKYDVTGVGGRSMETGGLSSLFPMDELTIIGFGGAMREYGNLRQRLRFLVEHIRVSRPALVVTIDSKAFSLRLGRALKAVMASEGWRTPIVHIVAPTVWAWGGWRARSLSRSIDHLLCLFPFEIEYFADCGVCAHGVRHPVMDVEWPSRAESREALSLSGDDFVVALFPGSREREVMGLLPRMREAAALLGVEGLDVKMLLPAAAQVRALIEGMVGADDGITIVDESRRYEVMRAADYGLICSGTVTLETALSGLEGSVYYDLDIISKLIGRLLVDRSKVVLPNAILGREVYPFYVNKEFDAKQMARQVGAFLDKQTVSEADFSADLSRALKSAGASFEHSVVSRFEQILSGL